MNVISKSFFGLTTQFDEIICTFTQCLFSKLGKGDPQYNKAFALWKSDFIAIHGLFDTQRKLNNTKIKKQYGIEIRKTEDIFSFVFTLETVYSIILRFIAFKRLNGQKITEKLVLSIFTSKYFVDRGVLNYDCKEYFNVTAKDNDFKNHLLELMALINFIDIKKGDFDFIKILFEKLFPREIRHSVGEFYTPDWLAEHVIEHGTANDNNPHFKTYLDPTCGSGTFLFSIIKKYNLKNKDIISNVYGLDINPLSVLAAKTNYLLLCDDEFIKNNNRIIIPIFNIDITALPTIRIRTNLSLFDYPNKGFEFKAGALNVIIPFNNYTYSEFISLVEVIIAKSDTKLPAKTQCIFEQVIKLDRKYINEFLDYFATLCIPKVDYVIGNPPWVNWEYLPKKYKEKSIKIWQHYKLFDYKGISSIFIKEDMASLLTYISIDNFLKPSGILGFVVKESLLKSAKQAAGFRKLFIPSSKTHLQLFHVDDLTNFKPFPGVNNRSIVIFIKKGEPTTFPVEYICWHPKRKKSFSSYDSLSTIKNEFVFYKKKAKPVDNGDCTSGFIAIDSDTYKNLDKFLGTSAYKARTGVFTGGANGIYWINIKNKKNDDVVVENITERARIKFKKINLAVEKDYVFPLVTGSELKFWSFGYSKYILCPHTIKSKMYPVAQEQLTRDCPKLFDFFETFKNELKARKGFTSFDKQIHEKYYYTLQRIGEYTFAPYKVAWRYISKKFTVAVIKSFVEDNFLGRVNIVPNEKIIYIGLNEKKEAYFLCGILSSSFMREIIESFTISTQISPSTISKLNIPKYDNSNVIHNEISRLCEEGHLNIKEKNRYLDKIDRKMKKLYSVAG